MAFATTVLTTDGQCVSVVHSDGTQEVVDGPPEALAAKDQPNKETVGAAKSFIHPVYAFTLRYLYVLTLVDMMVRMLSLFFIFLF